MSSIDRDLPLSDRWLDRWSPMLDEYRGPALDVGCGPGFDAQQLAAWDFTVTASDLSADAVARSQKRNPSVRHVIADARTLEPFSSSGFNVVVASLSLHYFSRADTHLAFKAVNRVLRSEGLFLFRVNAWDDYEFGAPATVREWELVEYRNQQKQFFTAEMIHELTEGRFELLSVEKRNTDRYLKPKSLFECIARKTAKPGYLA